MAIEERGAQANVSRFLDEMASSQADRIALKIPTGRDRSGRLLYLDLTFRELAAEQDAWGLHLKSRGICQGSRVLLMARPGLPLIALCFALFKTGAVPIVIDPGMGLRNFRSCVRRSRPDALVGVSLALWVARVFRSDFKSAKIRIGVGGGAARAPAVREKQGLEATPTRETDLAAILFTSGSTGAPKGVCYEHGMFEAQIRLIREHYDIRPGEVDLPMLPIFALFNPALGMTTVVPEINPSKPATVDPAKIVQAIRQCGVTNSFGSPVLWKKIGAHCQKTGERLPELKRILVAGASTPPALMEQFRAILSQGNLHSPYGATEVLPVASIKDEEVLAQTARLTEEGKGTCVGRPLPGISVRILEVSDDPLDASALRFPLGPNQIGEIVVTGPSVTKKYDQLPDATRAVKIEEGARVWHRMGDLGYFDNEGRLWFCGRKVERVITPDKVFYTDCCEGVFNKLPQVARSALIRYLHRGEAVPAIVVEPVDGAFPKTKKERERFVESLNAVGSASEVTRGINHFLFEKKLPVDVRHNAKIHRLTLSKRFNKK